MVVMSSAVGANRMMIMMPIAMIPIQERIYAIVWTPPTWPIPPVVRGMPAYPRRTPEPIINNWLVDIYRFNNIICTVYIFITNHLHSDLIIRIFLHKDRSYVLIDILGKDRLDDHQVAVVVGSLDDTQIVHFSIAIEVEIRER